MKTRRLLSEFHKKALENIAKRFKLRLVVAFGSCITGRIHARSDIDIAVLAENPDFSFDEFSDLAFDLQELFPHIEVDLAIINQADPLFLKKILDDYLVLYGKPEDMARLRIYAFKRYMDHGRFFKMEEEYARKFIKRYS
ncbi:MAG: nucleotidyltransferase domain-containing protein [Candidatus Aquicultor sp.]|nr:nucleotidyltransferase domain-containing protein [Candidatus Aquicultor sp.]